MTARKYDWISLKQEYMATGHFGMSLKELSEKHNIPYPTIRRVAAAQGWTKERWILTRSN